ncbi:MAG: hypothetical protein NZM43_13625 [Saprospiraceae bacterium]|nr:hypothetical protein [Saprospiraceae bacterium]MDW8485354.1 hypothetical protein [Saprospiraceae bacterium]
MKNFLLPITFLIFFLLPFCIKETPPAEEESPEWGEANALLNGVPWKATCATTLSDVYPGKFSLLLTHYNSKGFVRGRLSFRHVPIEIGTYYPVDYPVENQSLHDSTLTCSCHSLQDDGDVAGDRYVLWYDSALMFRLERIDSQTKEIWGTFRGMFKKHIFSDIGYELDPRSPDTLIFEAGSFHAKLSR